MNEVRVKNPMTKNFCDCVPKSIADMIHDVYDRWCDYRHHDDETCFLIAEIYYWNVDLFIHFIWDGFPFRHKEILWCLDFVLEVARN